MFPLSLSGRIQLQEPRLCGISGGENTPELQSRLLAAFQDRQFFIASQVGIPETFPWNAKANYDPDDPSTFPADLCAGRYVITEHDHSWHEFTSLELTNNEPTDPRSFERFVAEVEEAACAGWKEFEPATLAVARRIAGQTHSAVVV